ncbi:hypothetical protein Misp06_00884 [Microbulbifer sp. NBRC 101763]
MGFELMRKKERASLLLSIIECLLEMASILGRASSLVASLEPATLGRCIFH